MSCLEFFDSFGSRRISPLRGYPVYPDSLPRAAPAAPVFFRVCFNKLAISVDTDGLLKLSLGKKNDNAWSFYRAHAIGGVCPEAYRISIEAGLSGKTFGHKYVGPYKNTEKTIAMPWNHELRKERSPGDAKWLQQNYQTFKAASSQRLCAVVGDRGFDSAQSRQTLQENKTFNGLCPRDASQMKRRRRKDEIFVAAQKRRAQTEARIAILKNFFLNGTPRAKGFQNRQLQVAWAVLAHNLWVVARSPWVGKSEKLLAT